MCSIELYSNAFINDIKKSILYFDVFVLNNLDNKKLNSNFFIILSL